MRVQRWFRRTVFVAGFVRMTKKKSPCAKVLVCAGLLSLPLAASAYEDHSTGVYVDAGRAPHDSTSTDSLSIGVILPWGRQHSVWGTQVSSYADLYVSRWRAPTTDRNG